jgi:hypothetical protein
MTGRLAGSERLLVNQVDKLRTAQHERAQTRRIVSVQQPPWGVKLFTEKSLLPPNQLDRPLQKPENVGERKKAERCKPPCESQRVPNQRPVNRSRNGVPIQSAPRHSFSYRTARAVPLVPARAARRIPSSINKQSPIAHVSGAARRICRKNFPSAIFDLWLLLERPLPLQH